MSDKKNGKGNGHDKGDVVEFPTLAQRDRIRRERQKQEKAWQKQYKKERRPAPEPFFNTGSIPPCIKGLMALILLINVPLLLFFDIGERFPINQMFGFVPGVYTGSYEWQWSALAAPITHIFLHRDWMHLVFNTIMLLVMGLFTERTYGSKNMVLFFILSGLAGALLYFILNPFLTASVIGASGGISGLFAITFLTLLDQGQLGAIGRRGPLPIIIFWILLLTGMGMMGGDVAWQAHLGGFLGGLGIYYARKHRLR